MGWGAWGAAASAAACAAVWAMLRWPHAGIRRHRMDPTRTWEYYRAAYVHIFPECCCGVTFSEWRHWVEDHHKRPWSVDRI